MAEIGCGSEGNVLSARRVGKAGAAYVAIKVRAGNAVLLHRVGRAWCFLLCLRVDRNRIGNITL